MSFADIRSEIPRTFFHILGGLFLAGVGYLIDPPLNRILLGTIFAAAVAAELLRLLVPRVNDLAAMVVGPLMRPYEKKGLSGAAPFAGGVFLAFLFFDPAVALVSLVPLVFGDRAGLLVGKSVGRISFKGKTLEGSLACFTASLLFYVMLAQVWPAVFDQGGIIYFWAALIGTLAEALPRPFDDNLTIPLAVGLFLTIVL